MTGVHHHPSGRLLARFVAGEAAPGMARIVEFHLKICDQCAMRLAQSSAGAAAAGRGLGGRLLEPRRASGPARRPDEALIGALGDRERRKWRWAGPGTKIAPLPSVSGVGERVYALSAKPGVRLPRHGHKGMELVLVVEGAFEDGHARFEVGDVSQRGKDHTHRPVADKKVGCVCLIATEDKLLLKGLARLVQPFIHV